MEFSIPNLQKLLSISGAAGVYITQYLSSENYYRRKAETRLLFGVKVVEPTEYIERGEIDEELNRLFGQNLPYRYYIIAGPTGSGKTTLIKHIVSGKNAVIKFRVDETTGLMVAQQKILSELGINPAQFSIQSPLDYTSQLFDEFRRVTTKVPVVVIEVAQYTSRDVVNVVFEIAKKLSADDKVAQCIIVLNDITATTSCVLDPDNYEYIWMPDFSIDEANRFLDSRKFNPDPKLRSMIYEKLGTRPSTLHSISVSSMPVDHFIADRIQLAKESIEGLLACDPRFEDLLKKLTKQGAHGVLTFRDMKDAIGVTRSLEVAEGPAVKDLRVLAYNVKERVFTFYSQVVYCAAKEYFAEKK